MQRRRRRSRQFPSVIQRPPKRLRYLQRIFNPVDISENLKKQGGFIPGVKPGARTAEYIDHVVSRITFPGSLFLTFIALLPVFIADMINVPFRFGGTSLLIVVNDRRELYPEILERAGLRLDDCYRRHVNRRTGRRAGEYFEDVLVARRS